MYEEYKLCSSLWSFLHPPQWIRYIFTRESNWREFVAIDVTRTCKSVWWLEDKNCPNVAHTCRKRRLKLVPSPWGYTTWVTLSPGATNNGSLVLQVEGWAWSWQPHPVKNPAVRKFKEGQRWWWWWYCMRTQHIRTSPAWMLTTYTSSEGQHNGKHLSLSCT
jgi:hypothetical protein